MRVLGVDFGRKRVGVAVSDPTGTIATPLETLTRRAGRRAPIARLESLGRELGVEHVVVGLPLDLSGEETDWSAEVRRAGERLAERLGVGVSFVDERFSSVRAERAVRSLGLPRSERERKERVDAAAAQLILQAWLDSPEVAR
ncbi:MAG TPA: Holliday junction resolvase RuvX [Longimicrobiales bacterium]|nr:Holliday junction resolvase RuvX [Longimicrobiales bacterium]